MTWKEDDDNTRRFYPEINRILGGVVGEFGIQTASDILDQKKATDLVIHGRHVAVRLRKAADLEKWGHQVTLRSGRMSGTETELSKVIRGYGDWLFYGFADNDRVVAWVVVSLDALRAILCRRGWKDGLGSSDWGETSNHDQATSFAWFDVSRLSESAKDLVVDHSDRWPDAIRVDVPRLVSSVGK